jgi:hypothetical protein
MSWKGTGRSGIGEQSINGQYDDWDGLSMNGRQFKSRETKETRDLSGADYWHQRKALEPKMLEDIPTYVNGRPNIQAFVDPVAKPKPQAKKKSAFTSVSLPDSHYERLCTLSEALDLQLDNGELSMEDWVYARRLLDTRLSKAWSRLCLARNWNESGESLDNTNESGLHFSLDDIDTPQKPLKRHSKRELTGWATIDALSDENVFKGLFCSFKRVIVFASEIKKFLKEK